MMSDINMLGSGMLNRIMRNTYGTLIITENEQLTLIKAIITQHLLHPQNLSTTTPGCNVLSFSCGK
ncbi:unnamed protein product [Prunus armeniaca]